MNGLFLIAMKFLKPLFVAALGIALTNVQAQDDYLHCGERENRVRMFGQFPNAMHEAELANQLLEAETHNYSEDDRGGGQTIYTIPVVFHVIHNNGPENISDAQIMSALSILNRDYRKLNSDTSLVVNPFKSLVADIGVEFALATKDPNGNCTRGINRIVSPLTTAGDQSMKDLIIWPRNKYMNVWICADAAGAAGYTNLPGDVAGQWGVTTDGIVIRADYVGSIGTSSPLHSRALTHEVGHWLNLYHTWGAGNTPADPANCGQDDMVDDTPNTEGWTSCNLLGATCGSAIDNVQNYMEYSYCSRMFTEGQRIRMRAALTSSTASRNNLWTNTNLIATGVLNPALCVADFSYDESVICAGDSVHFTDLSYHAITTWTWNFGDGTTITGTNASVYQNPYHTYTAPGNYTVTLTVSNSTGQLSKQYLQVIHVLASAAEVSPFTEGFESTWPGNNWFLKNPDADEAWEVANASYTGVKGLRLMNYNSEVSHVDEMISNTFDMSAMDTIYISYKWAYANRVNSTDDRLRISASGDCGDSWTLCRIRKGTTNLPTATATNSSFVPSSTSQWNGETLTLTSANYMTNHFQTKFEFICYGGNNVYLDDINITGIDSLGNFVEVLTAPVDVNLFPNPAENNATLQVSTDAHRKVEINLFNSTGQLVKTIYTGSLGIGTHNFELTHEVKGLYVVQVKSGVQVVYKKVIFN